MASEQGPPQSHRGGGARAFLVLISLAAMLPPVAINMHVPVMGRVEESLRLAEGAGGLTVTVYLWVFGLTMLGVGIPLERLGRRGTLLGGSLLYGLGALGAALMSSLELVLVFRSLQAIGAAAVIVTPRTMVSDRESGARALMLLGWLGTMQGVAPALGPLLGTAMAPALGWQSIWMVQGGLALGLFAACWALLPETKGGARAGTTPQATSGLPMMTVVAGAVVMAMATAMYFVFLSTGLTALAGVFAMTETLQSLLLAFMSGCYVVGNTLVGRLGRRLSSVQLLVLGSLLIVVANSVIMSWKLTGIPGVLIGFLMYAIGNGIVLPACLAIAGQVTPERRATVMSLTSASPYVFGGALASGTVLVSYTSWPNFVTLSSLGNGLALGVALLGLRAWKAARGTAGQG